MIWLTWLEADRAMDKTAEWLQGVEPSLMQIYPISKGGDPLAVMLSHRLGELPVIHREDEITDDTLVIEDIVHSGKTIAELLSRLKKRKVVPRIAAWVLREGCLGTFSLECYALYLKSKDIVKFPWETEESAQKSFEDSEEYIKRTGA